MSRIYTLADMALVANRFTVWRHRAKYLRKGMRIWIFMHLMTHRYLP